MLSTFIHNCSLRVRFSSFAVLRLLLVLNELRNFWLSQMFFSRKNHFTFLFLIFLLCIFLCFVLICHLYFYFYKLCSRFWAFIVFKFVLLSLNIFLLRKTKNFESHFDSFDIQIHFIAELFQRIPFWHL